MKTLFRFSPLDYMAVLMLLIVVGAAGIILFTPGQEDAQAAIMGLEAKASEPASAHAKYVFLFIGDGMGLAQQNAAQHYLAARQQTAPDKKWAALRMSRFPVTGLVTTESIGNIVTDSAAAGTAIASGKKTAKGRINTGTDALGYTPISERIAEKGMLVGVISSVSLNHATPAVFYARSESRHDYYAIGAQVPSSALRYIAGGGFNRPTGKKNDQPHLNDLIASAGFQLANTREELQGLQAGIPALAINPNLAGGQAMPYAIDATEEDISLAEFTRRGIELLDNDKGFFLMVEGGKIDWACHANDTATCVQDVLAFDEAIGEALAFQKQHPEDTLIIVTADHETGGMHIVEPMADAAALDKQKGSMEMFQKQLSEYWKNTSESDRQTTAVLAMVDDFFGLTVAATDKATDSPFVLSKEESESLLAAIHPMLAGEGKQAGGSYNLGGEVAPLVKEMLDKRAGFAWLHNHHTGVPVPLMAKGRGAEMFQGFYDNTDIPKRIARAMGL